MKRFALWFSVLASTYAVASPAVHVELRSSWSTPPFLLQMLEAFSAEEPDSFFPFLDALTNPEWFPLAESSSDEDIYKFVVKTALAEGYLTGPGELASLEMSLALHTPLPKLEAAYQYYSDIHGSQAECLEGSWVDWYGQAVCDALTLKKLVDVELIDGSAPLENSGNSTYASPRLLPFDHIQPSLETVLDRPPRTAVLYASLESKNFRELHEYLYRASMTSISTAPHIEYVLRHIPPGEAKQDPTKLSGYGVVLDLKKTDYLVLDDRRQGSGEDESKSSENAETIYDNDPVLTLLHQYPENSVEDPSTPLTPDELLILGMQATQLLYDSGSQDVLATLKRLAQDFPKYALDLARRVTVDEGLDEEVLTNQAKAQGGASMVWLNGVIVPDTDWNPFSLLRLLRKEREIMHSVLDLGLTSEQAIDLLTHRAISVAQADTGVLDGIFDASDRPEGGGVLVWLNDLEKDKRYERWGSALSLLLRPMYPGQMPTVKQNIFNIVLVVDLSQSSTLHFIGGMVNSIIERSFGYRWGIAPIIETEDGTRMARLLYWIQENLGSARTVQYISRIARLDTPIALINPTIDWLLARAEFTNMLAEYVASDDAPDDFSADVSFESILSGEFGGIEESLKKAKKYAHRLSADLASASQGHVFVNGKHFNLDDEFLRNMQTEAGQQLLHLQEQLYYQVLSNEDGPRMSTYFYDRPEASKRRNKHVYPSGKANSLRIFSVPELLTYSNYPYAPDAFVYPQVADEKQTQLSMTTFVVADLDSKEGLQLVQEILTSTAQGGQSRVSFIHNPSNALEHVHGTVHASSLLGYLATKGLLQKVSPSHLLTVLSLGPVFSPGVVDQASATADGSFGDWFGSALVSEASEDPETYEAFMRACRFIVRKLKLSPGEQALIVNGRIVGPIGPGEFIAEDFNDLISYEYRKRVFPVIEALDGVLGSFAKYEDSAFTDLVTLASSIVSSIHLPDPSESGLFNAPIRPRRRIYQSLSRNYTRFEYGNNSTALFHFGLLLDPVSETAQKWASLMEWLLNDPAVYVELHINPARYKEMPLKRFYRYNVLSKPIFDEQGQEIGPSVQFQGLPEEPIYTLSMDVAPSWMVRPREALYDLDNIVLSALSSSERAKGVHAVFSLDYLVIEGHARESKTLTPPRGLQMQLVTSDFTPIADTLVVANLGYLQFRTTPGVFRLEIRPGRGRDVFEMESVGNEGWDSPSVEEVGDEITLMSFEGLTLYPRVKRRPGMEDVDVLADPSLRHDDGVLNMLRTKFSSLFQPKPTPPAELAVRESDQAEINIFTVASGLLYERFASIMILSVLRNTKSTVKFWFIENFLSPSFLEFIPHFAEEYGFKYELVTYKWPSWLRTQKEKQRIIWAYKILFLDVLFPMNLKKVIFVDADQIVRADLKELVHLDLHGAPYAYTPMGNDNVEMEGFRFWKTGYWKEFLQGLPYHISALYVVDLVRFRQMTAGDILRSHYQHLSADPGSLANLDQDLPNNLQREVPIFSLDEDWLWCETWCSKDRLHRAKTIDLCQNPLTKEPKLARAKHIPEWEEYDSEVARLTRQLAQKGVIQSGMAVADANVLADAGAGKATVDEDEIVQDASPQESEKVIVHPKDEL